MTPLWLTRVWLGLAGLNGAVAVAMDAAARHHFDPTTGSHARELIQISTKYQGLHALALIAMLLLLERAPPGLATQALRLAGWAFIVGMGLFCLTLYGLAFGCPLARPALMPLGGSSFIAGWLGLLVAAFAWKPRA